MNAKELFDAGCFMPDWTCDETEETPISTVHTRQNKDLQTLLNELDEIKDQIQEIEARKWHLARLLHFHRNEFVKE